MGLFPSGFPNKNLFKTLLYPIRATCPTHFILLDFITRTKLGEQYRSLISSLCNFLHSPVSSTLLGPNILLNTQFSNTFSLRFSLNVSDQVSHPYKTTGKNYMSVYRNLQIFEFLNIWPGRQKILHAVKIIILKLLNRESTQWQVRKCLDKVINK
jgi:hypothetical protein